MPIPSALPRQTAFPGSPSAPVAGNGWSLKVLAHTDYHTLAAEIPRWMSLQFSKVLNDKGAGTAVISQDDQSLFPLNVLSLAANPLFAGGSIAQWGAVNSTIAASQAAPPGGQQPWSLRVTPNGTNASVAAKGTKPFAVIPGQGYELAALACPTQLYTPVSGVQSAKVATGFNWLNSAGGIISTVTTTTVLTTANQWAPVTSGPLYAPVGAVSAVPWAGQFGTPPTSAVLYLQAVTASYDSGAVTLGDYLLDYEHLWQVRFNGVLRFEFLGETVTEQQVDTSEQRVATITGPGGIAALGFAAAMPPGFPDVVFKTDAIQDGFAEVGQTGQPALDTAIWNVSSPLDHIELNPLGTCQLTASPSTTFLGAQTYDITESSIAAQMSPISGSGLDGSQLTQFYVQDSAHPSRYALIGLSSSEFYAQVGNNSGSSTKNLGTYSSSGDLYWRISESGGKFYFWTSADGQNWTQRWSVAYDWKPTTLAFFITAKYDVDNSQAVSVTNINGDIITPSSAGNIFIGQPIMSVWFQLLQQAQARGTIPYVTTLMGSETDSYDNPWPDSVSVQIQNGTDLFGLLQTHAAMVNADFIMQPGFVLQVGMPNPYGKTGVGIGRDLTRLVVFREAHTQTTKQKVRSRDQVGNLIGAVNSDGTVVTATDAASIAKYGQRETWVQSAATVNAASMNAVVLASVDQLREETLTWTVSVIPDRPGAVVFQDYDVGDWVGQARPGGSPVVDSIRVIGIAIGIDASNQVTCELTLNSYQQWLAEQLQYLVNKFGGQFINALGTTPVTSTSTGPGGLPQTVAPSLGGLADVTIT